MPHPRRRALDRLTTRHKETIRLVLGNLASHPGAEGVLREVLAGTSPALSEGRWDQGAAPDEEIDPDRRRRRRHEGDGRGPADLPGLRGLRRPDRGGGAADRGAA